MAELPYGKMSLRLSDLKPMEIDENTPKVIGLDTCTGALAALGTDGRITLHGDQTRIKTTGTAHISIVADLKNVPREVLAVVYGIDRYIDPHGRHRIESLKAWEAKTFDPIAEFGEFDVAFTFIFKKDDNGD